MRSILSLALGFWIARQIYINYDKEAAIHKETQMKKKLKEFLADHGLSLTEADKQTKEIIGV
ncbi:MAG: hypothetical protein ABJQ69_03565 [Ekhidna sp.]